MWDNTNEVIWVQKKRVRAKELIEKANTSST